MNSSSIQDGVYELKSQNEESKQAYNQGSNVQFKTKPLNLNVDFQNHE